MNSLNIGEYRSSREFFLSLPSMMKLQFHLQSCAKLSYIKHVEKTKCQTGNIKFNNKLRAVNTVKIQMSSCEYHGIISKQWGVKLIYANKIYVNLQNNVRISWMLWCLQITFQNKLILPCEFTTSKVSSGKPRGLRHFTWFNVKFTQKRMAVWRNLLNTYF